MNKKQILGVDINDINIKQAVKAAGSYLSSDKPNFIITPNPEILLGANQNLEYKKILNTADLSIPDGVGLRLCSKIKNRVRGADYVNQLLELANKKN